MGYNPWSSKESDGTERITLSLFRMDAQKIRRDMSHYTLTHTHTSVSPACRILVQKQGIT